MASQQLESKWEGKSIANLKLAKVEQVWAIFEDFFNIHNWLPTIDTCHQVNAEDEIVRYCASTATPSSSDDGEAILKWCHERLLTIDKVERCLSYEALDNNIGIRSYVATFKVLPSDNGGCKIVWSFVADPIDGLTLELFSGYVDSTLQGMAENIENALINKPVKYE